MIFFRKSLSTKGIGLQSHSDVGPIRTMVVWTKVIRTLVLFGLQSVQTSACFGLWSFGLQGFGFRAFGLHTVNRFLYSVVLYVVHMYIFCNSTYCTTVNWASCSWLHILKTLSFLYSVNWCTRCTYMFCYHLQFCYMHLQGFCHEFFKCVFYVKKKHLVFWLLPLNQL